MREYTYTVEVKFKVRGRSVREADKDASEAMRKIKEGALKQGIKLDYGKDGKSTEEP